jgi:hypothetical protein
MTKTFHTGLRKKGPKGAKVYTVHNLQVIQFRQNSAAIPPFPLASTDIHAMKIALIICLLPVLLPAQNLQLHYDLRHFPTLYFEYFKAAPDSSKHLVKPGSFLLKTEADLLGANNNIGKYYIQVSQSFRAWKPRVFLSFQYSGGAGITEPKQYSYYITNTWSLGIETPFHWKGAWFSSVLDYKYVPYTRPTHDFLYTFYWWKGLFHYKWEISGDFSCWTENRDHGDPFTAGQKGKRFFLFGEPQVWYYLNPRFAIGSKINFYYHVYTPDNLLQIYPTIALKVKW